MRPAGSDRSRIPSGRKCYLCLPNELLPMCPEWTREKWSGRVDLNHRPLGPEPSLASPICERFRISSDLGSNRVATRKRQRPAFAGHRRHGETRDSTTRTHRPACCATVRGATVIGMTLKARVKAGRLVVDEPTDLPERT